MRPRCKRQGNRLGARAGAELRLRVADVRLHCRRRELEPVGDLFVGCAVGKKVENLTLTRGWAATGRRRSAKRLAPFATGSVAAWSAIRWRPGRRSWVRVASTSTPAGGASAKLPSLPPAPRVAGQRALRRSREAGSSSSPRLRPTTSSRPRAKQRGWRRGWPPRTRSRRRRRAAPAGSRRPGRRSRGRSRAT